MKIFKKQKTLKIMFLVAIFLSIFILNLITPLVMDDFNYTWGLNGRISSITDIFQFQIWHYFNWGGRIVAHSFAQFFLMNNKIIFNIFNSLMYVALIYIIYIIIKGKNKDNPLYILLIHFSLWFLTPVFGQSFIWLTGSCNYLWTSVIVTLFIYKFFNMKKIENTNKVFIFFFFLFGLITGWTNENSAAGLIAICLSFIIINKVVNKIKINKMQISGLLGVIIGFLLLIFAPGNFVRVDKINDNSFFIIKIFRRIINTTLSLENFTLFLLVLIVILISFTIYKKKKINPKVFCFIIGFIVTIYSMVLSPLYPERSWTITIIFMTITCGILLYDLDLKRNLKQIILVDSVLIVSLLFVGSYILAFKDSYKFYKVWEYRIETINAGKKEGIKNYKFEKYFTTRPQTSSYGLADLYPKKKDANNKTVARYFGIDSIQSTY